MAEPKSREDRPPEFARVEATAHLTSELDREFELNYPLAEKDNGKLLEGIRNGEIPFFSFNIFGSDKDFLKQIMVTALRRATDPKDYSFSIHGDSGHVTYKEAVRKVIASIESETVDIQKSGLAFKTGTDQGEIKVPIGRFVLTSPPFERKTSRPFPHEYTLEMAKDPRFREEGPKRKLLRKATLENGIAFGILVGFYTGETIDSTLDLFADPNFKKTLLQSFGDKVKIPSRSRGGDITMLTEVAAKLTIATGSGRIPSPSPERYLKSLDFLIGQGYLNSQDKTSSPYNFVRAVGTVRARVVLKGGTEAAQKIAPPELLPPERVSYIDQKYGDIATSEVITAFLFTE